MPITKRPFNSYASMAEAPSAADYGVGPLVIGGAYYWSDGQHLLLQSHRSEAFTEDDVIFFGDSRMEEGHHEHLNAPNVTNGGNSGVRILGMGKAETTAAYTSLVTGTGSIQYDGPNKLVRWRAPVDAANSYGPWTIVRALEHAWLASSTPGQDLLVCGRRANQWTTLTESVPVSQGNNAKPTMKFRSFVPAMLGWDQYRCTWLATGGEVLEGVSEALDWVPSQYPTKRCWIMMIGTNNSLSNALALTGVAAVQQIVDKAKAAGAQVFFVGNTARWGTASNTPMAAQQISDFKLVESAIVAAANANPHVHYCDLMSISLDRANVADFRPISSPIPVMRNSDPVHPNIWFSQKSAEKFVADFGNWFVKRQTIPYFDGNAMPCGTFGSGTSGGVGTGASGTVPTGWSVSRVAGADVAAACSIVDNPYGPGKALKLDLTSTAEGTIRLINNSTAWQLISYLGKAAGNTFRMCLEIADLTAAINSIDAYLSQYSAGPTNLGDSYIAGAMTQEQGTQANNWMAAFTGAKRFCGPRRMIESNVTHIYAFVDVKVPASYSGSLLITLVGIY